MKIIERDDGVKEIFLEAEHEFEHMIGKFVEEDGTDMIIDFSCDVYKPNKKLGVDDRDESLVLIKYRKNAFPEDMLKAAYEGLEKGATTSQNRGIAAGPRSGKLNNRDWYTMEQQEILEAFQNGTVALVDDDPIDEIRAKWAGKDVEASARGIVWLHSKVEEEKFNFNEWVDRVRLLPPPERRTEANRVMNEFLSDTTYANQVNSGIAGYFDRYPRIPYCRETSYSANNPELFEKAIPFIDAISNWFKVLMPNRYAYQLSQTKKIDDKFLVGDSVYTTITINKNFRTACHYDAGDLAEGFGNIVALSNGIDYDGAYLVFPKYRVAVDLRPGDMLCFDPHELHGNTEISSKTGLHERITVVLYFREKMLNCESKIIEDLRFKFIETRRKNTEHPEWRPLWNGVSPSCFMSEEWIEFLLAHGMNEYVQKTFGSRIEERVSLDDFF